jgi:G3E family GTPase
VLRQLNDANIIVLNKTDLVNEAHLAETKRWLGQKIIGVRIIESSHSIVAPQVVLGSFLAQQALGVPHFEASDLEMMTVTLREPVDVENLAKKLADDDLGLVRAKGFVTSLTGKKTLIQVVGRRWEISLAPDSTLNGIVCLGFKGVLSTQNIEKIGNVAS